MSLFDIQKVDPACMQPSNWPSSDSKCNFTEADVCCANIVVYNFYIIELVWPSHIKRTSYSKVSQIRGLSVLSLALPFQTLYHGEI
jgi:hypothetical protein